MAAEETAIVNEIRLEASKHDCVLWKNVRGNFRTMDGKRIIKAGLMCDGSSDLIGYKIVEITPEMIGKKVPVFLAVEVKTETGTIQKDQVNFLKRLKDRGCFSGVARCVDDFKKIIGVL